MSGVTGHSLSCAAPLLTERVLKDVCLHPVGDHEIGFVDECNGNDWLEIQGDRLVEFADKQKTEPPRLDFSRLRKTRRPLPSNEKRRYRRNSTKSRRKSGNQRCPLTSSRDDSDDGSHISQLSFRSAYLPWRGGRTISSEKFTTGYLDGDIEKVPKVRKFKELLNQTRRSVFSLKVRCKSASRSKTTPHNPVDHNKWQEQSTYGSELSSRSMSIMTEARSESQQRGSRRRTGDPLSESIHDASATRRAMISCRRRRAIEESKLIMNEDQVPQHILAESDFSDQSQHPVDPPRFSSGVRSKERGDNFKIFKERDAKSATSKVDEGTLSESSDDDEFSPSPVERKSKKNNMVSFVPTLSPKSHSNSQDESRLEVPTTPDHSSWPLFLRFYSTDLEKSFFLQHFSPQQNSFRRFIAAAVLGFLLFLSRCIFIGGAWAYSYETALLNPCIATSAISLLVLTAIPLSSECSILCTSRKKWTWKKRQNPSPPLAEVTSNDERTVEPSNTLKGNTLNDEWILVCLLLCVSLLTSLCDSNMGSVWLNTHRVP